MSGTEIRIKEKGDFEKIFGFGSRCDIVLPYPSYISEEHAALKRSGDRLFIRDCRSKQGTFLNGRRIGRRWNEITLHDKVSIGAILLNIDAKLLLGKERITLDVYDLSYSVCDKVKRFFGNKQYKTLCNHISFTAKPGTMTAIIGPSGAGKTTLLNLLNGYLYPTADNNMNTGKAFINDEFDVHRNRGLLRDIVGYVPQDDTIIPELTVQKSLEYCLRLGFSDMERRVRASLIEDTCKRLGFNGQKLDDFLRATIGSQETKGDLSGGERKRANIAHELARNPLLLFLDEPTSGLSSVDADNIVSSLRDICTSSKITIVLTIHQPGEYSFKQFDMLLLLNHGGNLAYFGPAKEAIHYFQKHTKKQCMDRNPAEFILEVLDNWTLPSPPEEVYKKDQHYYPKYISCKRLPKLDSRPIKNTSRRKVSLFKQFMTLFQRNISVALADKTNLFLQLGQSPIIALFILISFIGYTHDFSREDTFSMVGYYFTKEYERTGRFNESNMPLAKEWAKKEKERGFLGEMSANRKAAIFFLLIAASIWFGIVNSCREIVGEKSILKRETKGPLRISSYISAKVFFLSLICAIQTCLLLIIITTVLLPEVNLLYLWGILLLTAISASCLGLCISAAVRTQRAALTTVPLVIMPQLILGGLIRPIKYINETGFGVVNHIHDLMLQKWAFKAMLLLDSLEESSVFKQVVNLEEYSMHQYIKFKAIKPISLYFDDIDMKLENTDINIMLIFTLGIIVLHGVIPLFISYLLIKRAYK